MSTTRKIDIELSEELIDSFLEKIDRSGGLDSCWPWKSSLGRWDYAIFSRDGKNHRANRVMFWLFHQFDPIGLDVHHTCGRHDCVNPYHLMALTHSENQKEAARNGRLFATRGPERRVKLDEKARFQIRQVVSTYPNDRYLTKRLASEFAVHPSTINRFRNATTWKKDGYHLTKKEGRNET